MLAAMSGRPIAGSRLRGALALAGTLALTGALSPASAASAAETVVGFDNLSAGMVVANQYNAQGLELGTALTFGQPSPGPGDCGPPAVGSDPTQEPPSKPNYAVLEKCVGTPSSGTYGALLNHHPR
jgi:hypothetical protein